MSDTFDQKYFQSGNYETTTFKKYSMYWWSNRFYTRVVRRYAGVGGRLLEIGCGLGHLLSNCEKDYETYGIDVNEWAIEQARINAPKSILAVLAAEELCDFKDNFFMVVVSKHVLEHVPDPLHALQEIARVLVPGGTLIFSTPNLDCALRKLKGEQWHGYVDTTHISLKRPVEWIRLTEVAGLNVICTFSDGFWNVPYIPIIPSIFQKIILGAPGAVQAILGIDFLPVRLGESLIVVAKK